MQKRIYRFEIVCGVSHAVYQAKDTAGAASVTLYEWTPDVRELPGCLKMLDGLAKSDAYEVFSSGASLYLAAPTEQAGVAGLKLLREAGLFQGVFVGAGLAAPPLPPPPPPPVAAAVATENQGWIKRMLLVWLVAIVIILLLGVLASAFRS